MLQNSGNETILSLVNILKGQQVSSEAILQALELICKNFYFDCGLVYETDFTDYFCLVEHYGMDADSRQERNIVKSISTKDQRSLAQKPIISMERGVQNTPLELQLLDLYRAQQLLIVPIVDEHANAYGFVVLLSETHKNALSEAALDLASIALSLLTRYAGARIYQKKIIQIHTTLENILDNAGVDIYVNDLDSHEILYTNASMAAPYGGKEQFANKKCWQVLYPGQGEACKFCPQKKLIDENGEPTKVYSWDYQRAFDGKWFRVFSSAFNWVDGRLAHLVSSADISENKRNEALIENLAYYDPLTQLPNRRSLLKDCESRISNATDTENGYLLFFDIDGFKIINDNYGHDAGDEFLIQLGAFFSGIPMLKDGIYRNGGDEFVAIMGGESVTKDNIKHLVGFIHERFKTAWELKNGEVSCNISVGVACYPEDGITPQELLQKADKAMYTVKKSGGGGLRFGYELPA